MESSSASRLFLNKAIWKVARLNKVSPPQLQAIYLAYLICSERLTLSAQDLYLVIPAGKRHIDRFIRDFKDYGWIKWHSGSGQYQRKYYTLTDEANRLIASIKTTERKLESRTVWAKRFSKPGRKRKLAKGQED